MARRQKLVTIDHDAPYTRDNGKKFVLREMPSDQGERWAIRAILGICSVNPNIPAETANAGFAGLASLGVKLLLTVPEAIAMPLIDEMFDQVFYQPPNEKIPPQAIIGGGNSQIEEVATRLYLRQQLLELHLGFSLAAAPPTMAPQPTSESGSAA